MVLLAPVKRKSQPVASIDYDEATTGDLGENGKQTESRVQIIVYQLGVITCAQVSYR